MQTVSRLIDQFVPKHYQLTLTHDRKNRTFTGSVSINGTSPMSTGQVVVHAKDLVIESATLDGKQANVTTGENDELIITHHDINEGRHIVVISFSGRITDSMHGLYPCYYEHEGAKKELLATQFESHHAREVFPCIDEPEAKATFELILTTEPEVTVLSNMPIKQQRLESNQLVTFFETTPRMSTYLLAWVVGELHRKTAITKGGVEVNVWATPAQSLESLDYALDFAVRSIDFFDDYFGEPYPLPKSDHVAIPDFSAGAMENWGLIVYREVALLVDPVTTGISGKQYVASVVAHELSHQWFGNLVTMKWWNNLWLNESFARFMESYAPDALHPEWNTWLDFASSETISALRRDSLEGIQPVQTEVNHPDEINTLFDPAIVYSKGARLLRMLEEYIGADTFRAGLAAYFAAYKYGNTEGDDLWKMFSAASDKDIASFMNAWITQSGYPVVHATQVSDQLTLSQEQFFVGPHQPSEKLWPIPLGATDPDVPQILTTKSVTVTRSLDEPLRLNVGDTAHFITHYDTQLLNDLVHLLRNGEMPPLDRLQLLNEQTLLARGGVISSASLIPLLDAYKHETIEAVWNIISLTISELRKFVETDTAAESKLRGLVGVLAHEQYERLGWSQVAEESESDTKLRAAIISLMVYSEDSEIIETAKKLYESSSLDSLDPELRPLILSTVVRYGNDPTIIDTLLAAHKATHSAELREDIANALTSTRDKEIITRLLGLISDSSIVRSQDMTHWLIWLLRNRDGRELAWQWLQDNWSFIERTFGSDKSYDAFPKYAASFLATRTQLEEYKSFFTPMLTNPALARVITIGLSEIEGRVALIEQDSEAVHAELAKL
ncbi:MAG: putative Aminopeptidase [Candidatus Saccharibacteria bacterium]|nr:putative Aminopeptidase [Candidatus Saccharibacteria bacterium]